MNGPLRVHFTNIEGESRISCRIRTKCTMLTSEFNDLPFQHQLIVFQTVWSFKELRLSSFLFCVRWGCKTPPPCSSPTQTTTRAKNWNVWSKCMQLSDEFNVPVSKVLNSSYRFPTLTYRFPKVLNSWTAHTFYFTVSRPGFCQLVSTLVPLHGEHGCYAKVTSAVCWLFKILLGLVGFSSKLELFVKLFYESE